MGNSVRLRALALVTTGIVGTWAIGGVAAAEPPAGHAGQGQHLGQTKDPAKDGAGQGKGHRKGKSHGNGQGKGNGAAGDRGHHGGQQGGQHGGQHGQHAGHAHAPGQQGGQQGGQHGSSGSAPGHQADPPGNNGTVKIAGPGDAAGHPSNNPHPGCTFLVEWFGYDEGADVVSTVSFASQAPTSDVVLGGTAPSQVFVGGDAAGGGTDLDGRQEYTLTFQGEPHPQQGYHVKLTVATPHSLGNDTKTKVFWVEPCAAPTPSESPSPSESPNTLSGDDTAAGLASGAADSADQGVLGETYTAGDDTDVVGAAEQSAAVPTAVDAGEDGALPGWARSPLPLTLASLALVLLGVGIVLRNRSRA